MPAPLRSTPRPSALPPSQTAPVVEFKCLFTHDIKRKQKRWQDGYLKFHAFNSRVMVYDQSRNHVGDTYWKESAEPQEGDELSLDRGVMVEVSEPLGVTNTDLTPLFEKRSKEQTNGSPGCSSAGAPAAAATVRPFQRPSAIASAKAVRGGSQLRHKSLNTLLGPSRGPAGKAVPMQSPYQARQEQENDWVVERAAKRQKVTQQPNTWRASSPVEAQSPPRNALGAPAGSSTAGNPPARVARTASAITISSDTDALAVTSDVTLPGTPSKKKSPPQRAQQLPRQTVPKTKLKAIETPKRTIRSPSPPVSATNRLTNVDVALQPTKKQFRQPSPQPSPPRNSKAKSLRLSAGVKRGTLICQTLAADKPMADSTRATAEKPRKAMRREKVLKEPINPRLHSRKSPTTTAQGRIRKEVHELNHTRINAEDPMPLLPTEHDDLDDPDVVHGIMDELLLSSSAAGENSSSTKQAASTLISVATNSRLSAGLGDEPKQGQPSKKMLEKSKSTAIAWVENGALQRMPLDTASALKLPTTVSRAISPAHTENYGESSRNSSTSPSKPVLSTGGIRKKQKKSPTESGTHVQKPKKRSCLNESAVEKEPQAGRSPSRSFRRLRSENDAPIPSTAADWEKRNLPKASSDLTEPKPIADTLQQLKKAKVGGLAALVKKTDPRNRFQPTNSLNLGEDPNPVIEAALPSLVVDRDVGPWSTEAFDLFDWRPPNRD